MNRKPANFHKFLKNFPLGLLSGAILAFVLAAALDMNISDSSRKNWTYLISFFGALIASALAVAGVLANITNQNSIDEERRMQNLRASQAVLPLALTRLTEICEHGIGLAHRDQEFFRDTSNIESLSNELSLDPEILRIIQDCIRHGDENFGNWLRTIVVHYQVYRSRTIGNIADLSSSSYLRSVPSHVADWVTLKFIVAHLFNYSRGAKEVPMAANEEGFSYPMSLFDLPKSLRSKIDDQIMIRKRRYQPFNLNTFSLAYS